MSQLPAIKGKYPSSTKRLTSKAGLSAPDLKSPKQLKLFSSNKKSYLSSFTFIDLFAGIGGFHLAMHDLGGNCVFAAEIDKYARQTYEENLYEVSPELFDSGQFASDITEVNVNKIPDFDILCAGFPCQPFSQAGFKKGFDETRGTLFFNIVEILQIKKPKAFFLENVRHLKNHDDGKTFETIKRTLQDLGYSFDYKVVKASEHGLPQHRPRLFMVGFRKDLGAGIAFEFPAPEPLEIFMSDVFGEPCNRDIGFTLRVGGRGSGLLDRRNWDCYFVGGKEVRLSSKEGLKMQGFPENFQFSVSETQAMKQLGNSVAIPAIRAVAQSMLRTIGGKNDDLE